MEVRIGVVYTSRELVLDMEDDSATVTAAIEAAINGKGPLMWLTDSKGRKVGIPGESSRTSKSPVTPRIARSASVAGSAS